MRFRFLGIFVGLASLLAHDPAISRDSTYVPRNIPGGDCDCPFEMNLKVIDISKFTSLKITLEGASTASADDMYATVNLTEGKAPKRIFLFQGRVPQIGENWTIGPLSAGVKVDFRIFSKILSERTTCDPNRWGEISDIGIGHWKIAFEDWCDWDWDDIVIDVNSVPGRPAVNILFPADRTSFITDNDTIFRVNAEAWASDSNGRDISRKIDWLVIPSSISGNCRENTNKNFRIFDFTAWNIKRRKERV